MPADTIIVLITSILVILSVILFVYTTGKNQRKIEDVTEESKENSIVEIMEITTADALDMLKPEKGILIDIRTIDKYEEKHIKDAISIPSNVFEEQIVIAVPNKNRNIILYSEDENELIFVIEKLQMLEYKNYYDLIDDIDKWEEKSKEL
jgi:rhodanese-related sulfurtransferase